jgi:DNA polymerase
MERITVDLETFSQVNLKERGAHIYAADPSTDVHFLCWVLGTSDDVQVWRPGDEVSEPFTNPTSYWFVFDNWTFENAIWRHVLVPRYGFKPIPYENQDCTERLALASAYPAELGLRCEALRLPHGKNPEARKAMLRLSRPQTGKKRKKPIDPTQRERDMQLLLERCKTDVLSTRAAYNSQLLRPLLPVERTQLLLDAKINERGICANVPFLEAVRDLAIKERNAVNVRLNELTAGVVTSVDQVARIKAAVNARGHEMTSLGKRSVAATLACNSDAHVHELLQLRQQGAYASVRMAKRLLAYADPADSRIRGALRIYGAGPGRWSSPGPQLHNFNRNDGKYPESLIPAVLAGNRAELARYGSPLAVAAGLSRTALCAKPGHVLICADFGAIESRVLAYLSGEQWKLDAYAEYDRLSAIDPEAAKVLEPYRTTAARMLHKMAQEIDKPERQMGKSAELACGFGGSVGAWRRIVRDGDPGRTDDEIKAIIAQWRTAHPAICRFWKTLARAARVAIRTGEAVQVGGGAQPVITAAFDGDALSLTLPSDRAVNYPGARLVPNRKFEDGDPDIEFFDNARRQWKRTRAWYGTLIENVVQATARDLLAAALLRFDARGYQVVFHCHDEAVIEVEEGTVTAQEVLAVLLEPPSWAGGLPLGGKVHAGPIYFEQPDDPAEPITAAPAAPVAAEAATAVALLEQQIDTFIADAEPLPATKAIERSAEDTFLAGLDETRALLWDLVSLPVDAARRVSCPFHPDENPSCSLFADHYFCHACGARGSRLDWLMNVEQMTRSEAIAVMMDWSGPSVEEQRALEQEKIAYALSWWESAIPLSGTLGERYLAETRGIDVGKLPATIGEALRFHPRCVFGDANTPCVIALMRDPVSDAPIGVQRIGLAQDADGKVAKLGRRALGHKGVVKLWPVNGDSRLTVGEGIETVLAAATRIPYRVPLTPAWSAIDSDGLAKFPVIEGVERLVILVDHDEAGMRAATTGRARWEAAGRTVDTPRPKQPGFDFNDVVLGQKA